MNDVIHSKRRKIIIGNSDSDSRFLRKKHLSSTSLISSYHDHRNNQDD